eukprot:CAMPEP_0184327714 /NCGR_PEP_ID=MMETSP1049-20130417/143236_1 /TAXON_ID=77928 /ORGANISM="Proteomonas sulcata, Strain CCMP704" /LENGTH=57 /DNA_ID=CAMNT_0026649981 /DNA_START=289 /DNA_END=462 /DNA_ORIENTATION=+
MASTPQGPKYSAIVSKMKENLSPSDLELIDDSAAHAGHQGNPIPGGKGGKGLKDQGP